MKVPHYRYRCPLGASQPVSRDLDVMKREGWRNDHILVVAEDDARLNSIEREFVRRIGERLYGTGGRSNGKS
jgi:hypothetical protein